MARIADYTFDDSPESPGAVDSAGKTQENAEYAGNTYNDGKGNAVFDGEGDYAVIEADEVFDLPEGTILIDFTQNSPSTGDHPWGANAAQTLFSTDATGFVEGGHLTIYLTSSGEVSVRHQSEDGNNVFSGGSVKPGEPVSIGYSWGPDGSVLSVNGEAVDKGSEPLVMAGGDNPITIGATQAQSDTGSADNLKGFFQGSISRLQIDDEALVTTDPVPCFVSGTRIDTPTGATAVEALAPGDLVTTLDHGPLPVIAVSQTVIDPLRLLLLANLRPIRIASGTLGNARDLLVSRQHCLLMRRGREEVLVRAAHLARFGGAGFEVAPVSGRVRYIHLLLDRHALVRAEGALAETLLPSARAATAIAERPRPVAAPCRPICSGREARALLSAAMPLPGIRPEPCAAHPSH